MRSQVAGNCGRILIVEDDKGLRELIVKRLAKAGYELAEAADGQRALQAVTEAHPDVMLLDLSLPDMDGKLLVNRLTECKLAIPFIVMTGQGDERLAVAMMKLGAADYLIKDTHFLDILPLSVERLFTSLENERALKQAQDKIRFQADIIENSPVIAAYLDKDLNVGWANKAYRKATGLSLEELRGRKCYEIWNLTKPCQKCPVLAAMETGENSSQELTPENQLDWPETQGIWLIQASPVRDEKGTVIGAIEFVIDITERKHLEARLRQSEKMDSIGRLAGGIAHDFNNQLTGILGFAELLSYRLDDPELKLYAERIQISARRSADLTHQLLAFSRQGNYLSVPVDLHRIIAEVVVLLSHSIPKNIELHQYLKATPATVLGDPTQLQNALLNLAVNACDAMPEGGTLSFATSVVAFTDAPADPNVLPGRYLQISVTDNGAGMDASVMKHLFEPFFTTKAIGKGTGLGLASVHGAVINHHGTIQVESQLGKGTTCVVCLPLSEEAASEKANEATTEPIRGTASILVVDDEEMVCKLSSVLLANLGYKVMTCADGEAAIDYYRHSWKEVDLVILDMVMPRMGGMETFLAMRKINPKVKALLASGYSIDGEARRILDEGALAFIQKPYPRAELAEKVAAALAQP